MINEVGSYSKGMIIFTIMQKEISADRSLLIFLSEAKESKKTAEAFLKAFHIPRLLPLISHMELTFKMSGDLKSIYTFIGLRGAASSRPCPFCHVTKKKKRIGNKFYLQDPRTFYRLAAPRVLEDWQTSSGYDAMGLNQLNPEFKRIMTYFGESRIDHMVYFAPLHCILSFNSTWRNAIDPASWIQDYDEKSRTGNLDENEKSIVGGCKRIKNILLALKPLRPGNQPNWYGKVTKTGRTLVVATGDPRTRRSDAQRIFINHGGFQQSSSQLL